jgi:hypothetical protein
MKKYWIFLVLILIGQVLYSQDLQDNQVLSKTGSVLKRENWLDFNGDVENDEQEAKNCLMKD